MLFETDGGSQQAAGATIKKLRVITSSMQCVKLFSRLLPQLILQGIKSRVVWHTQGSGKSISMCCYAGKLLQQPAMQNPTLLIVTDRNDLDGQLFLKPLVRHKNY